MSWTLLWLGLGCGGTGPVTGDFSCRGDVAAPTPGAEETFTYVVRNPTDDVPYGGATVHVFADGVVTPTCEPPCRELVANDEGLVEVTAPAGWFAYRVLGEPTGAENRRLTTIEVDAVHPPDDEGFLNAVFDDNMRAIFGFARGRPDHELAKAVVRGVDCNNVPAANLRARVFNAEGVEVDDLVVAYLNQAEDFPAVGRMGSNIDGRSFLANLPDGEVRIELWGHFGDGVEERLACEVIPVQAGATTTARFRPLRSDADPRCQPSP